jgi:hypothetical protein
MWRVYANYGKGDTNKHGFKRKTDALRMARICRKHKGLKWLSVKQVKGKR